LERTDITAREKEVAKLLEQGRTNAEIASTLYLSEVTVKKHIKSMLGKLNATNRTQLLKRLLE
jgi:DNA-binding NarL/FixJ family response regulator